MPDGLALYYSVSANPYEELLNFLGRYVEGFASSRAGARAAAARRPCRHRDDLRGAGQGDDERAGIAAGATISLESEGEAAARSRRAAARHPAEARGSSERPFTIEAGE